MITDITGIEIQNGRQMLREISGCVYFVVVVFGICYMHWYSMYSRLYYFYL